MRKEKNKTHFQVIIIINIIMFPLFHRNEEVVQTADVALSPPQMPLHGDAQSHSVARPAFFFFCRELQVSFLSKRSRGEGTGHRLSLLLKMRARIGPLRSQRSPAWFSWRRAVCISSLLEKTDASTAYFVSCLPVRSNRSMSRRRWQSAKENSGFFYNVSGTGWQPPLTVSCAVSCPVIHLRETLLFPKSSCTMACADL